MIPLPFMTGQGPPGRRYCTPRATGRSSELGRFPVFLSRNSAKCVPGSDQRVPRTDQRCLRLLRTVAEDLHLQVAELALRHLADVLDGIALARALLIEQR